MITEATQENFVQPILQYDDKTRLWRLMVDYQLEYGPVNARKRLFIAAGFEYDKASVPRCLWIIARPDGPWEAASLFHDRLCRDEGKFPHPDQFRFETEVNGVWKLDSSKWHRSDADKLLEFVGVLGGANPTLARLYREAVSVYPPNWFKGF